MANNNEIIEGLISDDEFNNTKKDRLSVDRYYRNFIKASTKKGQNISFVYKETLRSIIHFFGNLNYINSSNELVNIKCLHANPERTVAKLHQETNIILPIISVSQLSSDEDKDRNKYSSLLIYDKLWNEEKQRAFRVVSLAPKPVNITYTVNVWSKYKSNLDQIVEQIRLFFNPSINIETSFSPHTKAFLVNEADNSSYDVGDREERVLRKAFDIQVQTYLPNPRFLITATGEIQQMNYEVDITPAKTAVYPLEDESDQENEKNCGVGTFTSSLTMQVNGIDYSGENYWELQTIIAPKEKLNKEDCEPCIFEAFFKVSLNLLGTGIGGPFGHHQHIRCDLNNQICTPPNWEALCVGWHEKPQCGGTNCSWDIEWDGNPEDIYLRANGAPLVEDDMGGWSEVQIGFRMDCDTPRRAKLTIISVEELPLDPINDPDGTIFGTGIISMSSEILFDCGECIPN